MIYLSAKGTAFITQIPQTIAIGVLKNISYICVMNAVIPKYSAWFSARCGLHPITRESVHSVYTKPSSIAQFLMRTKLGIRNKNVLATVRSAMHFVDKVGLDTEALYLTNEFGNHQRQFLWGVFHQMVPEDTRSLARMLEVQKPLLVYLVGVAILSTFVMYVITWVFTRSGKKKAVEIAEEMGIKNSTQKVELIIANSEKSMNPKLAVKTVLQPDQSSAVINGLREAKKIVEKDNFSKLIKSKKTSV